MKFGMNMLLWSTDVTGDEFVPILAALKEQGYDGVEIPIFDPDERAMARLGRRLDDLGLARTAINVRRKEHDPLHPDPAVRAAGRAHLAGIIGSCAALGADLLAGPTYAAIGQFSGRGPTADEWQRAVEETRAAAEAAERHGVTLALEWLNRFEIYLLNSAAQAARFARAVAHPRCRVMYDTFHAHIEEKDIAGALTACAAELCHVHVSENDRSTPGTGLVDHATTLRTLAAMGYDGWLTIEAFGTRLPALAAATCIWRRLFESELQLASDGLRFMRQAWAAAA